MTEQSEFIQKINELDVDSLISEVNHYIENVYEEMVRGFSQRHPDEIDDQVTYCFFRSKDRLDFIKTILQYLAGFAKGLPLSAKREDAILLFSQFKEQVQSYFGLLLADDVRTAIIREYERYNPLKNYHPAQDVEKMAVRLYHEIMVLVDTAHAAEWRDYRNLLVALQRECEFWFEIRGYRLQRIRRSDIFMYKLIGYILERGDSKKDFVS